MSDEDRQRLRLGVDIGGTFTDLLLVDDAAGEVWAEKVLTTAADPSDGFLDGMVTLLAAAGKDASEVRQIVHGTTLATNAIIERRGARCGLITTAGFEDVLEIGRERRYELYDLYLRMPAPLVPRPWRRGVTERVRGDGSVLRELDESAVIAAVDALVADGVQSIAVSFLHAYANDTHERRVAEIVAERHPGVPVSLSSKVARELKEFERTSAAVINAYIQPLMSAYLGKLDRELGGRGFDGHFSIMLSNGGSTPSEQAARFPVRLIESGPAAGVIGAAELAQAEGETNVIAFDMGGTTAKAALVDDGMPEKAHEFEVARVHRFRKGSGLPVKSPVIEMIEIGAGGGSIAWLDDLGLLKVGPQSASSSPGPAAYGLGGTDVTVTDADLLLGYLNPDYFLGGQMSLDMPSARAAAGALAEQLGLDETQVAAGIFELVTDKMASAFRVHIAEKGKDPRRYTLVATGGAGPVHAARLARRLGLSRVICPPGAGVASARGLLVAPLMDEAVQGLVADVDRVDWVGLDETFTGMERDLVASLETAGVRRSEVTLTRTADMRYRGQGYEVNVVLPADLAAGPRDEVLEAFAEAYRQRYGSGLTGVPCELVALRLEARGPQPGTPNWRVVDRSGGAEAARKGEREAWVVEHDQLEQVPVYDRYLLPPGAEASGPAIIEERESTVVVGADSVFRVAPSGSVIIDLK